MAIGFGQTMLMTPLVIMWKEPDGSMTVSQRKAIWYSEPAVERAPKHVATAVEPHLTSWQQTGKHTTFAFKIPLNETRLVANPEQDLIFALSPARPQGGAHAVLARHLHVGYLKVDFTDDAPERPPPARPAPKGSGPSTHAKTVLAHGVLLTLGFIVVLPVSVLTSRWARTFTPVWFKVHWILNWPVALPMILLGWLLGPIAVNQHDGAHFSDPHKMWGTVLVSVYLVQLVVGNHIHKRRAERTQPIKFHHPLLNIAHVVVGILTLAFAFWQVRTGLSKLERSPDYGHVAVQAIKAWNFWAVAVPFIYIVGLFFVPKQFAQEEAGAGPAAPRDGGSYVALDETGVSPSTRLLFDAEGEHGNRDIEAHDRR